MVNVKCVSFSSYAKGVMLPGNGLALIRRMSAGMTDSMDKGMSFNVIDTTIVAKTGE